MQTKQKEYLILKVILLLVIFFLSNLLTAQTKESDNRNKDTQKSIRTEIFWLDLCYPNELNTMSVKSKRNRGRLEANSKNLLSFGLINVNQFKYDYKINSVPFASFVDTSYASFYAVVNSKIDLISEPKFDFKMSASSPKKLRFLKESKSLDSTRLEFDKIFRKLEESNQENPDEYEVIYNDYSKSYYDYVDALKKFNDILSVKNEKSMILSSINKMSEIFNESSDVNILSILEGLKEKVYNMSDEKMVLDSIPKFHTKNNTPSIDISKEKLEEKNETLMRNQSTILETYQQISQIVRTSFYRFEIQYDSIRNDLLSKECKILNKNQVTEFNKIKKRYLEIKEVLNDIEFLYINSPLKNDYLEEYLEVANQYDNFLFDRFMPLGKVLDIDTVFINPISSNMKNFDLISIEFEKTNKVNNNTEKYVYDIYLRGGIKVDFSAGIFGTSLINHQFYTVDSLDSDFNPTNKKMIKREDGGKFNIGFGAMVNMMPRLGSTWIAPGLSFGIISSTFPSLQFTSSLSLSIGKTERLLLHGGYALGFVKRLDGLPLDQFIPSLQIGQSVNTIDRFEARPFFGLTYNLSKNNIFNYSSFNTSNGSNSNSK